MEQERASRRQWMLLLATGLGVALAVAGLGVLATRRANEGVPAPSAERAPAPALAPAAPAAPPVADAAGQPADAREREIADLLAKAADAEAELRLTTPEGDSAMFYYQQALSIDPERAEARDGVKRIVARYVALADSAAASGNGAQAATYLERASSISPNDPEVIAARARLAAAPPRAPRRAAEPSGRPTVGVSQPSARPAEPRYASFPQVKEAFRAGRIDEREYDRLIDELKRRREAELLRLKASYVDHQISREEYGRRVREVKLRYEGR
jgi:tetratricopeptide (TPR) repeat protein